MIHILKLSNGDTIVGDLISEDEECITLNNPLELQMVNNPMSGSGLMSMYWLPIDSEKFHVDIKQQHVIVSSKASNEIQLFYKSSVKNFVKKQQVVEQIEKLKARHRLEIEEHDPRLTAYVHEANTSILH